MEFTMSARTKLRDDFDADGMRSLARASKDAAQTRRLLALASIYDGGSHLQAARIGGVSPQIGAGLDRPVQCARCGGIDQRPWPGSPFPS